MDAGNPEVASQQEALNKGSKCDTTMVSFTHGNDITTVR